MKSRLIILIFLLSNLSYGQSNPESVGRLKIKLATALPDTSRVLLLSDISGSYNTVNVDSAYYFANEALRLSEQLNYKRGIASANLRLGTVTLRQGNIPLAISLFEKSIHLADSLHDYTLSSNGLSSIGLCMVYLEDYYRAIEYFKQALEYQQKSVSKDEDVIMLQMNLADAHLDNHNFIEAEHYLNKAQAWGKEKNPDYGWLLNLLGS